MKRVFLVGLFAVVASATLSAAVVESTDPDTGYKVLTVEAGEFAEYATVLDASVPGLIKRGTGTAWLTGANSAFAGPIQIEAGVLGGKSGAFGKTGDLHILSNATLDVSYQPDAQGVLRGGRRRRRGRDYLHEHRRQLRCHVQEC